MHRTMIFVFIFSLLLASTQAELLKFGYPTKIKLFKDAVLCDIQVKILFVFGKVEKKKKTDKNSNFLLLSNDKNNVGSSSKRYKSS